jgi:integrase
MKLTDRQIKNLKPKLERYEAWEGRGFGIRVFPSGIKSWVYMYRFDGKAKRITFGNYPKMSVAKAHLSFGKALADLETGIDPGAAMVNLNREDRTAPTVGALASEYLEKWAKPRKRSWEEDERMLIKDVIPHIGKQKAKNITRRDIVTLLDKVLERGSPIAANRTLAVTRRMFNFAVERDIIPHTPCYGIKAPTKEKQRDRVLSFEEIKSFWKELDNASMSELTRLALKFQLATAQRKGEIVSSEWTEFDLKDGWWTIPAHKAKNGNAHRVPLSKLALSLLQQIKKESGSSKWLFPAIDNAKHLIPTSIDHAIRRSKNTFKNLKHFTPHDLRRTAASLITSLGVSRLVVSKLLNHVENSVTAVYDRHTYDNEKKKALDVWGAKLNNIIFKNTG